VTKTIIDLDEPVFARAQALLGTGTKKETVNQALADSVRGRAIRAYLHASGVYDRQPSGLVLADASALVHCAEPAVIARLVPLLVLDELATCAAVAHELAAQESAAPVPALRQVTLHWLPTEDADLTRASGIQAELTELGQPPLPWSRLVVAAVASRYQATVLHSTPDFDVIAKVTGQPTEWVAPPGTLPEAPTGPVPL
jgi:predicted nucleic acid-binding protein/Arc/MetJ family transcription regulator